MTIAEGFCSIQCHFAQKKVAQFIIVLYIQTITNIYDIYIYIYRSHAPVQRSIQTEWHAGAICRKWARDAKTWHGLVATFGGSSIASQSPHNRGPIADQSRIFRSNGHQVGKKTYTADAVSDLGVWCSDFSMCCLLLATQNRCKNASLFEWDHYLSPWHYVFFFNTDLPFLGGCFQNCQTHHTKLQHKHIQI